MRHVGLLGTHNLLLHDINLLDKQHILLQQGKVQVRGMALPPALTDTLQHHQLQKICLTICEQCVTYGKAPNATLAMRRGTQKSRITCNSRFLSACRADTSISSLLLSATICFSRFSICLQNLLVIFTEHSAPSESTLKPHHRYARRQSCADGSIHLQYGDQPCALSPCINFLRS